MWWQGQQEDEFISMADSLLERSKPLTIPLPEPQELTETSFNDLMVGENKIGELVIHKKAGDAFVVGDNEYNFILEESGCGAYQCWSNYKLNIKREGVDKNPIIISLSKEGQIDFFEYSDILFWNKNNCWKASGACPASCSESLSVVRADTHKGGTGGRFLSLIEKDNELYLKSIDNYCFDSVCSRGIVNDCFAFYGEGCHCGFLVMENPPCIDNYYLLSKNGEIKNAFSFFRDFYLSKSIEYNLILENDKFLENEVFSKCEMSEGYDWLTPLIKRTVNLVFAGEEKLAWEMFDRDFIELSEKYPFPNPLSKYKEVDMEELKRGIQAEIKEFIE